MVALGLLEFLLLVLELLLKRRCALLPPGLGQCQGDNAEQEY